MIRLIGFSLLILALSCGKSDESSSDSRDSSESSINQTPSRWGDTSIFPLTLKYGSNFTSAEVDSLERASDKWSDALNLSYNFFTLSASSIDNRSTLSGYEDSEVGVYKVSSWPSNLPVTALGVTQIIGLKKTFNNEDIIEIIHADILINYEYFSYVTSDTYGHNLEGVLLHELGHFLGLYHETTSESKSVMYPTASKVDAAPSLKTVDIINIREKYSVQTIEALQFLEYRDDEDDEKVEKVKILLYTFSGHCSH